MNYRQLRTQARENLSGKWALAIAVATVAWLLGGLMIGNSFLPQFSYHIGGEDLTLKDAAANIFTVAKKFGSTTVSLNMLTFVRFLLSGPIQLSYAAILLKQQEKQAYSFGDLFSQFHRFGQGFAQMFLRELYTALWSLLLIVPGIIAYYKYAMTPYIMADHPEMSASEAIAASKEMMDGHKGELFILHFTFIGWDLLAAVTLNIGNLVLNPYKNAAEAAFYRQLCPAETQIPTEQ